MIDKDNNQQQVYDPKDIKVIIKALNTNWGITVDINTHEKVLKYIHENIYYISSKYVCHNMSDIIDYYAVGKLAEVDDITFDGLDNKEKELFCMIYISTLYTKWLIHDLSQTLTEKKKGISYNLYDDSLFKNGQFNERAAKNFWRGPLLALDNIMLDLNYQRPDYFNIKQSSTTPFLSIVFKHLIKIKRSFSLFLEIFYSIMSQMELSMFDYKTYNLLNDSVKEEKYEHFRDIIYGWDNDIIPKLAMILELLYPIFLFLETNIQNKEQNILDNIRCFLTEHNSSRFFFDHQPRIIESSLTSFILITIINYLLFNVLKRYSNPDVSECLHYFWPKNELTSFHLDYIVWINDNMKRQLYFFQNTAGVRLFDDSQTIINNETEEGNEDKNHITQDQANHNSKQQQELGSSDETGNPPEDKPKRHLSVGHDIEAIKKLATYLVKGFTNTRGSLPALVSSNDEKNITINKLIFLFTGNKDYSFDGKYNLTWNAERVYLKLLIKLLHNLNELATGSHAVVTNRADYISDEYIKCKLKGGVWPKVAEAFENIKSEATIRNADYRKNYKDTTAPINQKRLRDMKVIADLWLKCKDDIDF